MCLIRYQLYRSLQYFKILIIMCITNIETYNLYHNINNEYIGIIVSRNTILFSCASFKKGV